MDEAVEDGVSDGWIADDLVRVVDRDLAGDHSRTLATAVVHDFEQITSLLGIERRKTSICE